MVLVGSRGARHLNLNDIDPQITNMLRMNPRSSYRQLTLRDGRYLCELTSSRRNLSHSE